MPKLLYTEENLEWLPEKSVVETYLANELPSSEICVSAYAFVFKNGALLMTELKEGERPTRRLDIPGGHIDAGETLEEAVIREIFEETGVIVKVKNLVAYKNINITIPKPKNYLYPYPTSYLPFYFCEVVEETAFDGNHEVHGRVWLKPEEFDKSEFCVDNKILLDEIMKLLI